MSNGPEILIRAEASGQRGFGHLKRCMMLAHVMRKNGITPTFLIQKSDTQAKDILIAENLSFFLIADCSRYEDEISSYPDTSKIIFLDLVHRHTLEEQDSFCRYLSKLKDANYKIIFLDGLYEDAFPHAKLPALDAVIQPYVGADKDIKPNTPHWLTGGQYAILDQKYAALSERIPNKDAKNILLTFGGSDPQSITIAAMKSLATLQEQIKIRVIIGPYFSDDHKSQIKEVAKESNLFELVEGAMDLIPHYLWADIALGSSSTSRYEFAAAGLPSIFTSIYPYHQRLSEEYASYGIAHYIGYHEDVTPDQWRSSLIQLKNNHNLCLSMAAAGYKFIDRNGTDRLVKTLSNILF